VAPLLLAVDFDGTITTRDTLHVIVEEFGERGVWDRLEPALRAGELTVEDAMREQFASVRTTPEEVLPEVVRLAPVRPGFHAFLEWVQQRGHRVAVLSAGFRVVIDAVLDNAGIGGLDVRSNDIVFSRDGAQIAWGDHGAPCADCGRSCKRHDLGLRRAPGQGVVLVGDGVSDRCASVDADLVFARAFLADYLDAEGRSYLPFDDFHDVLSGLAGQTTLAA
jgi:2-hydroxy-3-keto-5-methylthiopentenyl-1-phosphate phosphatase